MIRSEDDYMYQKGCGSKNRGTTIFQTKDNGVFVVCGCFGGTLDEFREEVKKTHGDNKYAREYLSMIETAKIHFEVEG